MNKSQLYLLHETKVQKAQYCVAILVFLSFPKLLKRRLKLVKQCQLKKFFNVPTVLKKNILSCNRIFVVSLQ